jgi:hypothetical protein
LADLVRKAHACSSISQQDKTTLRNTVMGPTEDIDFQLGEYVLDLLGWYAMQPHCHRPAWSDTIPGHWAKKDTSHFSYLSYLRDSMRRFKDAITRVSRDEDVQRVLTEALEGCRRRCGLGVLPVTVVYWSVREGYEKLGEKLYRGWEEYKYAHLYFSSED